MDWFNKMRVGTKLLTAFLAVLGLTAFLGIFSVIQLERVNQTSTDMEENWMPSVRYGGEMNTATSDFRLAELQHILSADDKEMAKYEKDLADVAAAMDKSRAEYAKLISSPEEQRLFDAFKKNWDEYLVEHKKVIELSRANKNDEARALIRGNSQTQFDKANADLTRIVEVNIEGGQKASQAGDALYASSRSWVIGLLLGATMLGVALALFIARSLVRQLGGEPDYAASIASKVAAGDLTVEVQTRVGDTTSMLYAMKQMRDSLAEIVGEVRSGTDTIATASSQIASGNHDLSSRTEEQASSLEETASSMEELTTTVKQNADNARQANALAVSASEVATRGGEAVSQVVNTMGAITDSSKKIADIISVIDGIAFQTNILALNAAVEAARAGEQGRGFAVVASEVRTLAQRSAGAAKEIKGLISDSVEKVENGSKQVNDAGATMLEIVESVRRVTDIMQEITAATQEQTAGIEQINQAIAQMDQVTQQNASLVEEAAAASESMQDQAAKLSQVVSVFRLDGKKQAVAGSAQVAAKPATRPRVGSAVPARRVSRQIASVPRTAGPSKQLTTAGTNGDWEEF